MMNKARYALLILCAALLAISLAGCDPAPSTKEASTPTSYVAIDMGPSVELVADQYGTVMSVGGVDEQAQAMLFNEGGIVNVGLDVAIQNIITLAKRYGYAEDGAISLSAYSTRDEDFPAEVKEILSAACDADVQEDLDLILKVELEDKGYDMPLARYRLVARAAEATGNEVGAMMTADDKELLDAVKNNDASQKTKFGKIYDRAVSEARFALENARLSAKDGLYSIYLIDQTWISIKSFDLINAGKNAKRAFYANIYAPLRLAEASLSHYYASLKEYISNPVFTKEDYVAAFEKVKDFFHDLTVDIFGDNVTDSEGNVTRESVNAYMNTLYRSLPEEKRDDFEETYREIKADTLDNVNFDNFDTESIKTTLTSMFDGISTRIDEVNEELGVGDTIKDIVKNVFGGVVDFVKKTLAFFGLDQINFKELFSINNMIERLRNAEQDAYDEMELDAEDLDNIAALESTIQDGLNAAKKTFDDAVDAAKEAAAELWQKAKDKLNSIAKDPA